MLTRAVFGSGTSGTEIAAASGAEGGATRPLRVTALVFSLVLIACAALLVASSLAALIVAAYVLHVGKDAAADFVQQLRFDAPMYTRLSAGVVSLVYLGFAVSTLAAAALVGRRDWRSLLALRPVRWRDRAMLLLPAATLFYAALTTFLITHARTRHLPIGGPTDYLLIGFIILNLTVLAPCAEELFFRGWLYTGLRAQFGFWTSYVTTSVAFAAIHWDRNHRHILLVFPLAMALGLLRERSGSVKPTIALHAIYNLIIIAITLYEV